MGVAGRWFRLITKTLPTVAPPTVTHMWADEKDVEEYARRSGIENPTEYARLVIKAIDDLVKGEAYIPKVITNGEDKGKFIFEAWGSVEIVDKEGQILPVKDIIKAMPALIRRGGTLHLGHTNQPVGRIIDFWLEDYKGTGDKVIKGIKFKAELFDDFKSDLEAREGVLKGEYRMVSLGGKSHKGVRGMSQEGDPIEIMKDLEVWEFALVRKGINPLAWLTKINGVEVHKGDDDDKLYKDEGFMRTVHSLLLEGIKFNDAWRAAKDIVRGAVPSTRKNVSLTKGDKTMPEKTAEERINALEKGMEDLQKMMLDTGNLVKKMNETFDEKLEEIRKSVDIPAETPDKSGKPNPPPPIKKEGEEEGTVLDEVAIGKAIADRLLEKGWTGQGTPRAPTDQTELKKGCSVDKEVETSGELENKKKVEGNVEKGLEPENAFEHFKTNFERMMSESLNKGRMAPSEVPSFVEMGAEMQGIPVGSASLEGGDA